MRFAIHSSLTGIVLAGTLLLAGAPFIRFALAAGHAEAAMPSVSPKDVKWGDAPPALPLGAKLAVLQGDPSKPGPFTIRLRMPAGYRIPAHWHPTDENVTVISGIFHMGMGDKLDTAQGHRLPAGGFVTMPAQTRHFAWATRDTVVQVHAIGPFEITYVNPADDPRKR
jgi:hypothetical protein